MNNQSPMPSIKEIIFQAFGVTLPIRGGMGNSMENAVIIERSLPFNDYVSIEHEVLNFITKGRDLHSWNYFNKPKTIILTLPNVLVPKKKRNLMKIKSWQK